MGPLVVYHANCRDGFCAAWVLWRYFSMRGSGAEFTPASYGQSPPDCRGRDVIVVDFSYPREVLEGVAREAATLLVMDHHKTAQEDLEEFARNPPPNTRVVFDMEQSGAGLAHTYCWGRSGRNYLVDYVEDRDLWRHSLPYSKAVNSYISTLPHTFEAWDHALHIPTYTVTEMGIAVLAKTEQYVAAVSKLALRANFEGYFIPVVNAPPPDISELLHELCTGERFAMGWYQRSDGWFNYSLRSVGDFDVSALARRYGGGGHKNAAGFESKQLVFRKQD